MKKSVDDRQKLFFGRKFTNKSAKYQVLRARNAKKKMFFSRRGKRKWQKRATGGVL